jgi:hypothetical protein
MTIFRRFDTCTNITLLSLQAELLAIQSEFQDLCKECDISDVGEEKSFTSDFYELLNSASLNGIRLKRSLEALRGKTSEYSK